MSGKEQNGFPVGGKDVSADPAMEKVIAAQARAAEAERKAKQLEKDRKQILEEYLDIRNARPVPVAPPPKKQTKADSVRVSVGDLHGMMMDKKAVAAFLADLKVLSPDVIVLGGDILECGGWLAKHQPIGYIALCDYSYQEDVNAGNWFLDEVQAAAPNAEIHYAEGNHEDRVERYIVDQVMGHKRDGEFLRVAFAPESVLRLKERNIQFYRRSEIYVEGLPRGWFSLGKMHFTHELGKSRNAARDSVTSTAGNVRYFHTHRRDTATRVFPTVGICTAFNPGCLCSIQPVWQNSNVTDWAQGYAIDIIAKSGNFQALDVPIWRGESLASAMIERFKS